MTWLVDREGGLQERRAAPGVCVDIPAGWRLATDAEVAAERALREQRLAHGSGAHLDAEAAPVYRAARLLAERTPFRAGRDDLATLNAAATGQDGTILSGLRQPVRYPGAGADRPPIDIAIELDAMLERLNQMVYAGRHLEAAAFAMWRYTWIHPHADASGRSSRALGYAILLAGSEPLRLAHDRRAPGQETLTIPERLERSRSLYIEHVNQLHAAAERPGGYWPTVDVSAFAAWLGELAAEQIAGRASLEDPAPCLCGGRDRVMRAVLAALRSG